MAKQPTYYYGSGKRKTAASRVFLKSGKGAITVNGLPIEKYIPTAAGRARIAVPFETTNTVGKFDAVVTVAGSGKSAQADAIRHGISRALLAFDAETMRPLLRKAGLLTRDDRMVERKKYGLHKARRRGQYSKR